LKTLPCPFHFLNLKTRKDAFETGLISIEEYTWLLDATGGCPRIVVVTRKSDFEADFLII